MSEVIKKLKQAKELLDAGVLSQEEYEAHKAQYLAELGMTPTGSTTGSPLGGSQKTLVDKSPLADNPLGGSQKTLAEGSPLADNPLGGSQPTLMNAVGMDIGQYRILESYRPRVVRGLGWS